MNDHEPGFCNTRKYGNLKKGSFKCFTVYNFEFKWNCNDKFSFGISTFRNTNTSRVGVYKGDFTSKTCPCPGAVQGTHI